MALVHAGGRRRAGNRQHLAQSDTLVRIVIAVVRVHDDDELPYDRNDLGGAWVCLVKVRLCTGALSLPVASVLEGAYHAPLDVV